VILLDQSRQMRGAQRRQLRPRIERTFTLDLRTDTFRSRRHARLAGSDRGAARTLSAGRWVGLGTRIMFLIVILEVV
jgi:hypothetical protein